MKSEKRSQSVSLVRSVLISLLASAALSASEGRGSFFSGLVETGDRQPLGGAQVIVEPLDGEPPLVAYTDPLGLFRFAYIPSRAFVLRVNAAGFQPRGVPVDLQKDGPTARVQLTSGASGAVVKTVTIPSGPRNSGWGADWSSRYDVCGEAEVGYRIRSHTFRLQGDRSCGAWAECMPLEQSDTRVCWGFRLQGHSESQSFGGAVRASEGILTLTLERALPAERPLLTVFLLCSRETLGAALDLRSALLAQGFRVAELQSLDAPFSSRIVRSGELGSDIGKEAAHLVRIARDHLAKAGGGLSSLPTVSRPEPEAPPGAIEIWLGQSARQQRRD